MLVKQKISTVVSGIYYCIFLLLFSPRLLTAHETYDLARWEHPILYGSQPTLFAKKLYVNDQLDSKIKVYDVSKGFDEAVFLWESPGPGLGPGEIPKGAYINNLAVNPESGGLWVSHQFGYELFDEKGKFLKQIKMRGNRSHLVVRGNRWCMTSYRPFKHRKVLTYVREGVQQPLWEIDNPKGIPVSSKGRLMTSNQELHCQDGLFLYYDSSIGELLAADTEGEIQLLVYLPQHYMETFVPVNFDGVIKHRQRLRTSAIPYAYSGLVKEGDKLTLLRMAYSGGVVTERGKTVVPRYDNGYFKPIKIISEVSLETGAVTAEYFHPVSVQWLYLLGADAEGDSLLFFDMETGDKIYRVNRSELQRLKNLIF